MVTLTDVLTLIDFYKIFSKVKKNNGKYSILSYLQVSLMSHSVEQILACASAASLLVSVWEKSGLTQK